MSSPTRTREQAMRKRRLRIVIEVDVPAKFWNRRKLNQAATKVASAYPVACNLDAEVVLLTSEEIDCA